MKLLSFLLAILLLFQGAQWNIEDVSRMGALLEHAKFHADEYGDNFFVFLSKHYGDLQEEHHQQHQEERSEHERLPFQQHSYIPVLAHLYCVNHTFSLQSEAVKGNTLLDFHYEDHYAFLSKFDIFQPPRSS